jgi:hypothetical protein
VTTPISLGVLDEIAPGAIHEGLETPVGSRHGGRGDRAAFQDALGRAMAPPGNGGGAAAASPSPEASADPSTHADLTTTLLRLEGQPDGRGSSPVDEARSKLEQARRSQTRKRGARADAEAAAETADKTVGEAVGVHVQNAQQPRGVPLAGMPAPAQSSPSRTARAKGDGESAPAVDATSRGKLHKQNAAAQASALKSALDAAVPLDPTSTAGRNQLPVRAPGRQADQPEKQTEKDRDAAKRETGAAASRPEAPIPPPPEARVAATRPSSSTFSTSSPSASDGPREALPPSPGVDVQGAMLRHAAHLKIEAGAMGALELHLRVRDGALHLSVEGDAARAVEARAGELSRALAGEGLKLAPIETRDAMSRDPGTQQGDGGGGGRTFEERRDAWDEASESGGHPSPASPPRSSQAWPASPGTSGIHVKA